MNLRPLRELLNQPYSNAVRSAILHHTSILYREPEADRWFPLLLNRIFAQIMENPELIHADTTEPVLEVVALQASRGIDAIERGDTELLLRSAEQLTEAYCGLP